MLNIYMADKELYRDQQVAIRLFSFTGEPNGAAPEASPGAHNLPSLAPADMVGLVHHVG